MNYPKSYHQACNHLVHHGSKLPTVARKLIAQALRDLRKQKLTTEQVKREYLHLLFIAGPIPKGE